MDPERIRLQNEIKYLTDLIGNHDNERKNKLKTKYSRPNSHHNHFMSSDRYHVTNLKNKKFQNSSNTKTLVNKQSFSSNKVTTTKYRTNVASPKKKLCDKSFVNHNVLHANKKPHSSTIYSKTNYPIDVHRKHTTSSLQCLKSSRVISSNKFISNSHPSHQYNCIYKFSTNVKSNTKFIPKFSRTRWTKTGLKHSQFIRSNTNLKSTNDLQLPSSSKIVRIGSMWYKSSKSKLQKTDLSKKCKSKPSPIKKSTHKIISVRGVKFSMDSSRKQLVKLPETSDSVNKIEKKISRVDIGGVTYVQIKPGLLKKMYTSQTKLILSRAVNRSIHRVLRAKSRKLHNKVKYCMFFNRFGKCNKGNECKFVHDPENIAICTRFLRGTCKLSNCQFSHKLSRNKMPVCSYFLKGKCTLDECPYLHVKVNPNATPCKDFISGFCSKGSNCKKLHSLICQAFLKNGECANGLKCKLKHVKKNVKKKNHEKLIISQPTEEEASPNNSMSFISLNKSSHEDINSERDGESLKVLPSFLETVVHKG